MSYLERVKANANVSRRGFVKTSAMTAAMVAAAGMVGCSSKVEPAEAMADTEAMATVGSDGRDVITGEWVSAACWHNCGGRCVNKALVRDGVVVRQKTDDTGEDGENAPQQRSCPRGHSQRMQVFGADRLKYPMKRKNWSPENSNGELRGKDEWERISWEEAIGYVADELLKVYEQYGPQGVLASSSWETNGVMNVLNSLGGYVSITDSTSYGVYATGTPDSLGLTTWDCSASYASESINDRFDYQNSDYVVLHGANPAWSAPGMPMFSLMQAKKKGVKFVCIDPMMSATAQMLDAKWIPVRTGTDLAFLMGAAYEMLQLDQEKGDIIDWDFLNTYTIGFDDDNMPEDASISENIKGYLQGEYDGVPKNAEWASEICGTSPADIRWYAEILGKNNKVALTHGYSFARAYGTEDIPQMFMTLGAMGGHFGKPGHCCGSSCSAGSYNGGKALVWSGYSGVPYIQGTIYEPVPAPILWKSVNEGSYRYVGTHYGTLDTGEDRPLDIHVVAFEAAAKLQTVPNIMEGIKALRGMDFVFASAYSLNTQAKYADVVFPCTTEWERPGGLLSGNPETLFVYTQVVEPLYETKTDHEIAKLLAEACGLAVDEVFPLSEKQQFMNKLLGCQCIGEGGEPQTLLTITDADLNEWECEGVAQEGVVSLAEFLERGYYHIDREANDIYTYIAYKDFIDDPAANPRPSASGKFECYCQAKADELNAPGIVTTFKPYPTYQTTVRGWETRDETFPYNAFNPHYFRRSHSVFDNVTWLREAWKNPVYLSAADARDKGIENGDTVLISSPYGKIMRQACVLESLMPGMVGIPHGAWVDLDEEEEVCLAGADNVLVGFDMSGSGVSGYNNINVNFEKYDGEALVPDCERPQRIIEL